MKIMKTMKSFLPLTLVSFVLLSCETFGPELNVPMSEITVLTRSNVDETLGLHPIHVYAFFPDGVCVAYQTLEDVDDSLLFNLPTGNYTFYALAGITAEKYNLPLAVNASTYSPVGLTGSITEHSEVATGRADVTLGSGENELILTVTRVVAQIKASVSGLPANIADVTMSFNPVETQLLLDGSFKNGAEEKEAQLSLVKKENGEWHTTDSAFIFPSKAPVTVGITLIDTDGKKHKYSYNALFKIEANYKYEITANYRSDGLPDIGGIIKGTDWSGKKEYTFDFGGEEPESGGEPPFISGDIYQDSFYILNVEEIAQGRLELTLLHPKSLNGVEYQTLYDNLKDEYVNGLAGWELIGEKEARMINQLCVEDIIGLNNLLKKHDIVEFNEREKHLYEDQNGIIRAYFLKSEPFKMENLGDKERFHLRGMKKISMLYR
jgi:hypothetical protein